MLYNEHTLTEIHDLFERKKSLHKERDLTAEFYNLMMSYANMKIDNPEEYKYYLDVLEILEPYTEATKEQIREINNRLCELSQVSNINDTPYNIKCEDHYGFGKPKL